MREYLFELLETGGELSLETVLLRLAASAVIAVFYLPVLPLIPQRQHLQRQVQCVAGGC